LRPPENWHSAKVTLGIGAVTVAAWAIVSLLRLQDLATLWAGFIPVRASGALVGATLAPFVLTPLTATLVHGGMLHLLFNMLMHLFCGRSVETIIGGRQFAILYVVGAYAAAAAQYAVEPLSVAPMIGASGAISAVLGAYATLFGRNRVRVANPMLATLLNSLWLMAAWVIIQLILGFAFGSQGTAIAIAAHIGGFIAGMLLAKPLLLLRYHTA
jgi:membrane associated rhomboid family serine protease